MIFSDPVFLFLFLPAVLALVALAPRALRNVVLLLASLLFYAWGEREVVFVMLASIAVNHAVALGIERSLQRDASPGRARLLLWSAVVFNLLVLVAFKYLNWLWADAQAVLVALGVDAAAGWTLPPIRLPIGVSFFTFQALSYVVDVYRDRTKVQRSPVHFALYIALFPQLIAGPIVRYTDLAPQLADRRVTRRDLAEGFRRFVIGLSKKVLIADVLARATTVAFHTPGAEITTGVAWFAMFAFTVQVYCDFSGYSDMAIGLSRMFGFRLLENFRWPLISRSMTEFWHRWHISLSTWFRDYVFIPMGGSRASLPRTYFNLWTVFFLCGVWHGSSWNFVIWGVWHGVLLVIERAGFAKVLARAPRVVGHVWLFIGFAGGWPLFCTPTLATATDFCASLAGLASGPHPDYTLPLLLEPSVVLALVVGCVVATPIPYLMIDRLAKSLRPRARTAWDAVETGGLALALVGCFVMIAANGFQSFVYFRF